MKRGCMKGISTRGWALRHIIHKKHCLCAINCAQCSFRPLRFVESDQLPYGAKYCDRGENVWRLVCAGWTDRGQQAQRET